MIRAKPLKKRRYFSPSPCKRQPIFGRRRAGKRDQRLTARLCSEISPNIDVADSRVPSVSVASATAAISGGSSPKAALKSRTISRSTPGPCRGKRADRDRFGRGECSSGAHGRHRVQPLLTHGRVSRRGGRSRADAGSPRYGPRPTGFRVPSRSSRAHGAAHACPPSPWARPTRCRGRAGRRNA